MTVLDIFSQWRSRFGTKVARKALAAVGVLLAQAPHDDPAPYLLSAGRISFLHNRLQRYPSTPLQWSVPPCLPLYDVSVEALAAAWDSIAGGGIRLAVKLDDGFFLYLWQQLSPLPSIVGIYASHARAASKRRKPFRRSIICLDENIRGRLVEMDLPFPLSPLTAIPDASTIGNGAIIISNTGNLDFDDTFPRLLVVLVNDLLHWWQFENRALLEADAVLLVERETADLPGVITRLISSAREGVLDVAAKEVLPAGTFFLAAAPEVMKKPLLPPEVRIACCRPVQELIWLSEEPVWKEPVETRALAPRKPPMALGGAMEKIVDGALAVAPAEPPIAAKELRFLHGSLAEVREGMPAPVSGAFVVGRQYQVTVDIGPHTRRLIQANLPFPEDQLPSKDENELTVFFSEPYQSPEVRSSMIVLPPTGSSTTCTFGFWVTHYRDQFEGRVIVACKNRILQTALLKAEIRMDEDPTGQKPELQVEAVVKPVIGDLSYRQQFDLALLVNHGFDDRQRLTKLSGDYAVVSDIEDRLEESIREIRLILEDAINHKEEDGSDPSRFLSLLALAGGTLYGAIVEDEIRPGWLDRNPAKIQVVSAKPDSYLPLEFVYERAVPAEGAPLCRYWQECLSSQTQIGCRNPDSGEESDHICPLGFWGLTKIIERHAHDPDYKTELGINAYALQSEPVGDRDTLAILERYVYGPSDRVDAETSGLTDAFKVFLDESVTGGGAMARKWGEWEKEIKSRQNTLLMLMPHTRTIDFPPTPALEIGEEQCLNVRRIGPRHVRPEPSYPPPLVALLGCETALPDNIYLGFIPYLRRSGAALVLATLSMVLGHQVVPVAKMLIKEIYDVLAESVEPPVFAEVLLRVRRKALLGNLPVALSLVAFGDADWRIVKGGGDVQH